MYEKLSEKYGMSLEQAKANCDNIVQMAASAGLHFDFDRMVQTNTFDAHRLALYAKTKGLMAEMTDRLLRAHFSEGKHIGDHQTLTELATEIGLDQDSVSAMLNSNDLTESVREDQQQAVEYNIRSVPFFLINKKYAITGAQPTDVFVQSLKQIMEQDGPFNNQKESQNSSCNDDGCS